MKTPISWVGNKTSILPIVYSVFPLDYERYIEPFGGSGAVLLGKNCPDKFEVLNDFNGDLVNLFLCIRERPIRLIRELGFCTLNSRDDFKVLKAIIEKSFFEVSFLEEEQRKH
jgi:DNA adenine methylase